MSSIVIDALSVDDLADMKRVEVASFSAPWPISAYRAELTENRLARYVAARDRGALIGFAGIWLMVDEAHVSTIAVDPAHRASGIGFRLMLALLAAAREGGAERATLDVRISNLEPQRLYARLGFIEAGRRIRYYEDNKEDALIMTTGRLDGADQLAREALAREALARGGRLPAVADFEASAAIAARVER
jgi:ribosomal-protein-alanine N-acetyltransferase